MDKHIVTPENAAKFAEWLRTRGGIAVWRSINLSNPGATWSTPALNVDGTPTPKPSWQSANTPERIITSADDIVVSIDEEVKRLHIAIRVGSQGLTMKLTDSSSRRVRSAVSKAGEGAYYLFDYQNQEAVIMKPSKQVPLADYLKQVQFDFSFQDEGTITLLTPLTDEAQQWIDEHIAADHQTFGNSVVIEHRYAQDILEGIKSDGLTVRVR